MKRTASLILATVLTLTLAVPAMSQDAKPVTPCLPPGVSPEVLSWPTTQPPQVLKFASESGATYAGFRETLGKDDHSIRIIWVRGRVLAVKPNPDDQNSPVWYDAGLTNGETIYEHPKIQCQWQQVQVPPQPSPEQAPPPAPPTSPPAKPTGPTTRSDGPMA